MYKFIIINIVVVISVIYVSYTNHNKHRKKRGEQLASLYEFFNRTKKPLSIKNVGIGLIFGFLFGLIDNVGLVFGLTNFEQYIPGGVITKATIGNTYSDGIGALVGSGLSVMAKDAYNYDNDEEPIWVNFIGVVLGCIVGVIFGRIYTNN